MDLTAPAVAHHRVLVLSHRHHRGALCSSRDTMQFFFFQFDGVLRVSRRHVLQERSQTAGDTESPQMLKKSQMYTQMSMPVGGWVHSILLRRVL